MENAPIFSARVETKIYLPLLLVFFLVTMLTVAEQLLLVSDELYFNALAERLSYDQIQNLLDKNQNTSWIVYIIVPILTLCKILFITISLILGYYLIYNKWELNNLFLVVVKAELFLTLPIFIKLLWFLFIHTDYTLNDLQLFYPLSLLNLFDPSTVDPYLLYPLQVLNLFEVIYWFVLAYSITYSIDIPMRKSFGLVAASYGTGLLMWVALVMFLTVSLS